MSENQEYELLRKCRNGDRKAQKAIYDRLAPKMYPLCIRYVGNREVAQDILQDGFITLFSKLETYLGTGSFEGWARKIFVNESLMYLRKNDALKMSDDLDTAYDMKTDMTSPLEDISYNELMQLVTGLPTGFRTIFNMFVIEGYSHKEISEQMGITETTSRSQLNRARAWLKKRIASKDNGK